ncbi:MAG: ATP synthase F1 subunit delta [Candidatus Riflebacteria bacterium]|nr:ATP synthase F1 subunit delta [Candidatus Riflebacteria bacterium]
MTKLESKSPTRSLAETFFKSLPKDSVKGSYEELREFVKIYAGYPDFSLVLEHPIVVWERKEAMISKVFKNKLSTAVYSFIRDLIERENIALLPKIFVHFREIYFEQDGIKGITVKTALPLTREESSRLQEIFEKKYGKIEFLEEVDSSILGGALFYVGKQIIDNSVRGKLLKLKTELEQPDNDWLERLLDEPSLAS